MKDIENTKKESPVKEAPFLGLTGMGGGVASLMWAGAAAATGQLYMSGKNYYGGLGIDIGGANNANRSSPVLISSDNNWLTAMGPIGVKNDGTLWAWGRNNGGQLAQNDRTSRSSPTQIGTGTDWNHCGLSPQGTRYALKTDNTLWVWGWNNSGALGLEDSNARSSPVQLPGTWAAVSSGDAEGGFIATKTDGSLWCWGHNATGQLGQNTTTQYSSPKQVGTDTDWGTNRTSVSRAIGSALAVKANGSLWSWGYNTSGSLGQNQSPQSWSSPRQVGTDTTWRSVHGQLSGPGRRSVMMTKTNGTLWGMGNNGSGQLGVNDRTTRSSPIQVGTNTTWTSKSYGMIERGGIVIPKTDGTLWYCGGEDTQGGTMLNKRFGQWSSPTQIGSATDWYMAGSDEFTTAAIRGNDIR